MPGRRMLLCRPNHQTGKGNAPWMRHSLDLCARGVYFYEKLRHQKLPLRVANLDYDVANDPEKSKRLAIQRKPFEDEMSGFEDHGNNPDVLQYAICEKPAKDVTMIELVFFGRLRRWAFCHPNAKRQT
jgi:hypothetical protein